MLMDLMAGMFTGANYAGEVKSLYFDHSAPQNVGHLLIAMRPDLFISRQEFKDRADHFVHTVKKLPRAAGCDEILIPGEPEDRAERLRRRTGIPLTEQEIRELKAEAQRSDVAFPAWSSVPLDHLAE
jgi:LDH2 family malate/lactate/ureidoglycolate dehydrogenase